MSTAAIVTLIAILALAGIIWLVFYSGRRGEKHRAQTSIKPDEPHGKGHPG